MSSSELRSSRWFAPTDVAGLIHRASMRAEGIPAEMLDGRPVVGICNSWSELVNCNAHFRILADAVRRGVLRAGGLPVEFPTISLGENLMKPTAMLYRNLMAMDVEECIRAYPLDAVVLLGGCDKTIPAQLMGAVSADVPAIVLSGGPAAPGVFRGRRLGAGTDLWHYVDELRAGRMSRQEFAQLEGATFGSPGHCPEMGTASTMSALAEALGVALPGGATAPAMMADRLALAERTGRRAVALAREDLRPSSILHGGAFHNALVLLSALGGSTNAILHLLALARRAGVPLDLDQFDQVAAATPVLANVRPAGDQLFEDLHRAGGVPALLNELCPLLDADAITVTGKPLVEEVSSARVLDRSVITGLDCPYKPPGGLAVLRGSLAPDGAVLKVSAASGLYQRHRGQALVFESVDEVAARIDDPDLDVDEDSVLILRNTGPRGAPGMPEWGALPIPSKLLRRGVTDLLRISDCRMSGTAFGTVIVHVCPEAAAGGPLAMVRDGDWIAFDLEARRIDLDVPAAELQGRRSDLRVPDFEEERGYIGLYRRHVLQANEGADLDFLAEPVRQERIEPHVVQGSIGGW